MAEVQAGQRVRVKGHITIDAVPYGPGTYEVVKDEDADAGNNLTEEQAKRATRRQGTGEVVGAPAEANLESLTKSELETKAAQAGVEVNQNMTKAEMISALEGGK